MPDTREEAVRRIVTLSCTGREKYGLAFDAGEKFGREAALREAIGIVDDALNCDCGYSYNRRKSKYNTECGHAMNCPKYLVHELSALIPVAGKEEKA